MRPKDQADALVIERAIGMLSEEKISTQGAKGRSLMIKANVCSDDQVASGPSIQGGPRAS
jgi:hypothetical protein